MQARSRLVPVGEAEVAELPQAEPHPPAPSRVDAASTFMLMTALKALSQRAVVALAAVEHLLLSGAVFALWWQISISPTYLQLWAGGLFSAFILAMAWLRRK